MIASANIVGLKSVGRKKLTLECTGVSERLSR